MANAIFTKTFSKHLADLLIADIADTTNNSYYLCLGRVGSWANSDATVEYPVNTKKYETEVRRGMFAGKRITSNDVVMVVRRIDWTSNTVYNQYTSNVAADISNQNFYVLTPEFNVYKCISNGSSGLASTIMPTYVSYDRINTESDGYSWKYLYTLTRADRIRFLTSAWMPVRYFLYDNGSTQYKVQNEAIDGAIDSVIRLSAGSGYTNASNLTISVTGDGSGFSATANINTTNSIHTITILNSGMDYTFANLTISDAGGEPGTGASFDVVIGPVGGHGANPIKELESSNLMINMRVRGNENNTIPIQNNYRQIMLLRNPTDSNTGNVFTNTAFNQSLVLTVTSGAGDFSLDEYVYQGPSLSSAYFSGRVVYWDSSNNKIGLVETYGDISAISVTGASSGTQRSAVVVIEEPDLTYYSGDLLYIENLQAINRTAQQTDDFKIVLNFSP